MNKKLLVSLSVVTLIIIACFVINLNKADIIKTASTLQQETSQIRPKLGAIGVSAITPPTIGLKSGLITTLTATPPVLPIVGGTTNLVWTSIGATRCSAPWTVFTSTSGSQPVTITATTIFTITCTSGTSITPASITVFITPTPPTTPAQTPSSIVLSAGSIAPVGGVTNVAIPAAGATDYTGAITGYVSKTADKIKFTVTDGGAATSTITINGSPYTSGTNYQIIPATTLPTVVVTTTEPGKLTTIRTFVITVIPWPILGYGGLIYGVVIGADGKKWLDRNLGASRVAQSFDDYQAYGDLFQWGRGNDGHQLINHTTATTATAVNGSTFTFSATDTPGNNLFIKWSGINLPWLRDWRSPQNNNLWQGVNGINNPCPAGFRLPTSAEQVALVNAAGITNNTTAYSSSLKLPTIGFRGFSDSLVQNLGSTSGYWSSSVDSINSVGGVDAFGLSLDASSVDSAHIYYRASGLAVRCIKD